MKKLVEKVVIKTDIKKPKPLKIIDYPCPHCQESLTTRAPSKDLVDDKKGYWDSFVLCQVCKKTHLKKIWPNGSITVTVHHNAPGK